MRRRLAAIAFATLAFVSLAFAMSATATSLVAQSTQPPPPPGVSATLDSARAIRGARIAISLLTYGPGDEVFERFGHIALVVHDSTTGDDIAFNWGMFDFSQPNFLVNFLTGDTKYWMAGFNTQAFNDFYRTQNRRIRRQELAFTPVEKAALFEFVAWNARDENKFYRYDYYRDNCATRIRDAIDRVLLGALKPVLNVPGESHTWRDETARITASDLPTYAGIEVALGRNADQTLSKWDEAFLPDYLADHLAAFVVHRPDGSRARLVKSDTVIFAADRVPLPTEAPARVAMAALLGLTLAGLIAGLADAKQRVARILLGGAVALWYALGGVLGTLLLLAGTVTKHAPYMGANLTLLQLHPLMLVATWPVAVAVVRNVRGRTAMGISAVLALLALAGVILQLIPSVAQSNGVVLAVTVPVHVALAIAMWRLDPDDTVRRRASVQLQRAA